MVNMAILRITFKNSVPEEAIEEIEDTRIKVREKCKELYEIATGKKKRGSIGKRAALTVAMLRMNSIQKEAMINQFRMLSDFNLFDIAVIDDHELDIDVADAALKEGIIKTLLVDLGVLKEDKEKAREKIQEQFMKYLKPYGAVVVKWL